jgi:cold shock CspA family protein
VTLLRVTSCRSEDVRDKGRESVKKEATGRTFFRGTVKNFDDHGGYGYIQADAGQGFNDLLLVHRQSLRRRSLQLTSGKRVLFTTALVPRGLLATDVHEEVVNALATEEPPTAVVGIVKRINASSSGFIRLVDGKEAYFHFSYLNDSKRIPKVGDQVICRVVSTAKGLQAQDVAVEDVASSTSSADNWLAQATLARNNKEYDTAVMLFEKGMRHSPTLQLAMSYAAMEKNRNRKSDAMRIYEEGIKLFPRNAKLREDAGMLAASLGEYPKALRLLEEALELCRKMRQGGEKGVLIYLARIHYQMETADSLKQSVSYYQAAQHLFGRGRTRLPESDILALKIAQIRIQHNRGSLAVRFLKSLKFEIVRARLLDQTTEGAEFVVQIRDPELQEGYGLAGHFVVRCMFKATVTLADLAAFDQSVAAWARSGLADEQVALLLVSSLPEDLERILSTRIEDRKRMLPAVVPFSQAQIENPNESRGILRGVLDRWLYRRDLFAGNNPVVGRRFFGRGKPLAELREAISTSSPTGIFGLRKVGKTSLLQETQRRSSEAGDIVAFIDLSRVPADITDTDWLYWRLATILKQEIDKRSFLREFSWRLGGTFGDFLEIPKNLKVASAFDSDLTRLLRELDAVPVSPKPKIVFLLDEIERLVPTPQGKSGFVGFFDFLSYIRGVSQESDNFVVIITGANASLAEAAQFNGQDNPIFNFFREVYLQFLEPAECELMIRNLGRGMGLTFSSRALDCIYALTGGHPFFARQLCSFVAERYRQRPLDVDDNKVQSLVDHYLDIRFRDFEEIVERFNRDFNDELEICVKLARNKGRLPLPELTGTAAAGAGSAIKHLIGYQIVQIRDGVAFLTIDLLTRWLRKRYVFDEKE